MALEFSSEHDFVHIKYTCNITRWHARWRTCVYRYRL